MTTAKPEVTRLTPTMRPRTQPALSGHPAMMIAASTRSARPLANIQPHEPGIVSREVNDVTIWKIPSTMKNAVNTSVREFDITTDSIIGDLWDGIYVDVAVRDSGAWLCRVGYNITLLGTIKSVGAPE
jgi:hypothetical protein